MYASCGWFFDDVAGPRRRAGDPDGRARAGSAGGGGRPSRRRGRCWTSSAEAKSNRREAGTGADVFRRVARDRVTVAHAVAGAALADVVGAPRVDAGWDVVLSPAKGATPAQGAARSRASRGSATAAHVRSGAVETMAYTAQAGSAGGDGREGRRAISSTLADLDAETRAALVMAELPSLLPVVRDAKVLALAVEAARELPPDGETPEGVARRAPLTRVLLAALDGTPSAANLRLAGELVDIVALPDAAPERRVLEERVWALCAQGRPSAPLRALAEKVGIAASRSRSRRTQRSRGISVSSDMTLWVMLTRRTMRPRRLKLSPFVLAGGRGGGVRQRRVAEGHEDRRRPPTSPPTSPSTST